MLHKHQVLEKLKLGILCNVCSAFKLAKQNFSSPPLDLGQSKRWTKYYKWKASDKSYGFIVNGFS